MSFGSEKVWKPSEPEIEKILALDPTYAPALMAKAALQQQQGNARSAGVIYDAILGRTPDFAPAQKQLAALYLRTSTNLAEAYDLALKARNAIPDDPELAQITAELTYQKKDYVHALLLRQESARMKPLPPKYLSFITKAYVSCKRRSDRKDSRRSRGPWRTGLRNLLPLKPSAT